MVTALLGSWLRRRAVGGGMEHLRGGAALMYRNAKVHRADLALLVSGFVEPLLYLLSLGYGMAPMVGAVPYHDGLMEYPLFVAPGMLAAAAMTGAVTESTYNFFAKLKFMKLYEAVLATPVTPLGIAFGEIGWAVGRSSMYAAMFVVIMAVLGLMPSWWGLAALPAATLIGLAFAAVGMALTTYMRSWQDFDYATAAIFVLFLFSGTFAPVAGYPGWSQTVIMATPLYHGAELVRALTTGAVTPAVLWHVGYLGLVAVAGFAVTGWRVRRLLTP